MPVVYFNYLEVLKEKCVLTPLYLRKALQRFSGVTRVEDHLNNILLNVTQDLCAGCVIFNGTRDF
jgi:hypothetical protein